MNQIELVVPTQERKIIMQAWKILMPPSNFLSLNKETASVKIATQREERPKGKADLLGTPMWPSRMNYSSRKIVEIPPQRAKDSAQTDLAFTQRAQTPQPKVKSSREIITTVTRFLPKSRAPVEALATT